MKPTHLFTATIAALLYFCASVQAQTQAFSLQTVVTHNNDKQLSIANSTNFGSEALRIAPQDGNSGVVIWQKGDNINWAQAKYFVMEVFNKAPYSGVMNLEFHREKSKFGEKEIVLQGGEISGTSDDAPWISCLIGVLPQLKTKVVFPLSYLDAQSLFLPRTPRQLKGTVSGDRLDPADITKVVIRFGPYDSLIYQTNYEIASITLTNEPPTPYPALTTPIVDLLGQPMARTWSSKVNGVQDLIARHTKMRAAATPFPNEWSQYGGWKGKQFEATGFFRTQHDGKRWWFVDPEGYAFLSVGVDCINAGSGGPINGIEDLFEWLPTETAQPEPQGERRRGGRNLDFYSINMERVYGAEWRDKWTQITADQMRTLRVNTVGNWSSVAFARAARIPYVLPLNGFPSTQTRLYRDFPDVYDPEYRDNAQRFAAQLEQYKDDPYLVGYFLRNEPQWAFGYHNIAYEMFATTQASYTKREFISWISDKYQANIQSLNKAWDLQLANFNALSETTFKDYPSQQAKDDFHAFSLIMAGKYVDIPCDEVEKIDKNHLNLGMRYAWLSSDLLYRAGERFDVFSINGYGIDPPPTAEIAAKSGKPVMIGEFHHGATDAALPATGIVGVVDQAERAAAYRNYIEQGFARPELIGMHYFQWIDQPYTGRNDGENYNIGVITTTGLPYPELTEAMKLTGERIYDVATGKAVPYKATMRKTPPIHY